jgi:hypothetical protein
MAKSWSGFMPQNQHILEQWGVMEASSEQIAEVLSSMPKEAETESKDPWDTTGMFAGWPYDME